MHFSVGSWLLLCIGTSLWSTPSASIVFGLLED